MVKVISVASHVYSRMQHYAQRQSSIGTMQYLEKPVPLYPLSADPVKPRL